MVRFKYCFNLITWCILGWVLFVGNVSGFLSPFAAIVIRSLLSKCVSKSELGKIYSSPRQSGGCGAPAGSSSLHLCLHPHSGGLDRGCVRGSGGNILVVWSRIPLRVSNTEEEWCSRLQWVGEWRHWPGKQWCQRSAETRKYSRLKPVLCQTFLVLYENFKF